MKISMCACGSPACKHCNPNIWTNPHSEVNTSPKDKRIAELEATIAELRRTLTVIAEALDAYGVDYCRSAAKDALLEGE